MKCSHLMLLSYLINITDILSIQHLGSFLRTAVVHIFWHTSTSSILSDVNNQISTIFTFDNNIGLVNLRPHTYTKRYFNLQVIGNNNKVNRCQALRWALLIQTPQFPIFSCEIINFSFCRQVKGGWDRDTSGGQEQAKMTPIWLRIIIESKMKCPIYSLYPLSSVLVRRETKCPRRAGSQGRCSIRMPSWATTPRPPSWGCSVWRVPWLCCALLAVRLENRSPTTASTTTMVAGTLCPRLSWWEWARQTPGRNPQPANLRSFYWSASSWRRPSSGLAAGLPC